MKVLLKKTIISSLFALPIHSMASVGNDLSINYHEELIVSPSFIYILKNGVSVPLMIKLTGSDKAEKLGDAQIVLVNGDLKLVNLFIDNEQVEKQFNSKILEQLGKLRDVFFNQNTAISINDKINLTIDLTQFNVTMNIDKDVLLTTQIQKEDFLGPSTVDHISSVTNYDLGAYYNHSHFLDNYSSYLNFNETLSYKEHHIKFNGSAYNLVSNSSNSPKWTFDALNYERDYNGYRFTAGESISTNMTAVSGSTLYGFSLTNNASSRKNDKKYSLIPIEVYLPNTGEVHIYKDNKLINIQNFSLGNHEVDTSVLPFGNYSVTVETIVNGKSQSKKEFLVNKPYNYFSLSGSASWNVSAGMMEYNDYKYSNNQNEYKNNGKKKSPFISGSYTKQFNTFSSPVINSSLYAYDQAAILQSDISSDLGRIGQLNLQLLTATDNTVGGTASFSTSLPYDFGSIYGSYSRTKVGDKLFSSPVNSYTYGVSANLGIIYDKLGSINFSRTVDKYNRYRTDSMTYNNNLFSNKYLSLGLSTSFNRNYGNDYQDQRSHYFNFNMNLNIPISAYFNVGTSYSNGATSLVVSGAKSFKDSVIQSANVSYSRSLDENSASSVHGGINYATQYTAGNLSFNQSSDGNWGSTLTSRGSIAYTQGLVSLDKNTENAGVFINTKVKGSGSMQAKINGSNYKITTGNNFIALSPYQKYKIELSNDINSEDIFDISANRTSKATLYPGNVQVIEPSIKRMITVFGRILYPDGTLAKNTHINNHIGKTSTNEEGEFSMDIDLNYPEISVSDVSGQQCVVNLDVNDPKGAMWLGDLKCDYAEAVANNN